MPVPCAAICQPCRSLHTLISRLLNWRPPNRHHRQRQTVASASHHPTALGRHRVDAMLLESRKRGRPYFANSIEVSSSPSTLINRTLKVPLSASMTAKPLVFSLNVLRS